MNKLKLFLAVLASVMSLHAFGLEFEVDGIKYIYYYDGKKYETGVKGCSSEIAELTIPNSVKYNGVDYLVTTIYVGAFSENKTLRIVNIPDSVNTLLGACFQDCSSLEKVCFTATSGLKKIYSNAFRNCINLKKIDIPNYVELLYDACFQNCSALEEVNISNDAAVSELGTHVFDNCSSMKKITIPDAVTEIPNYCFQNCSALEEVNISSNSALAKLGEAAFGSCKSLKRINIPDAVKEISRSCFTVCSDIEEINISAGSALTKIGRLAFNACRSLKKINIPDAVTEIPYGCFSGCSALEEVCVSNNSALSVIGGSAFHDCGSLKKFDIPDVLTEIPTSCFKGCSALEEINISINSAISTIGEQAFYDCSSLKKINIPDGVTEIPSSSFQNCTSLEEISISANSNLIKIGGFSGCVSLKKINIPDALTEIPNYCFDNCSALEEVLISSNSALAKIGEYAFNKCSCLKKINIPDAVTEIPSHCFAYCSALEEVNISSNSTLAKIGGYAFSGCGSLKKFNIPDAVTEIPTSCFSHCSSLEEVNISINSAISKIGNSAFNNCISLKKITIPDAVTEIPSDCFQSCSALEEVNILASSSLVKLGVRAFQYCSSLKRFKIPDAVTEIPEFCFYESGLEFCVLSENITTISNNALSACNSLNSILFMQPTPPTMIRNLSNNIFIYVLQKNYDAYVEAGVDQYYKLIALNNEQVAEYKENGEMYGDGVNDYLAVTVDGKDLYNYKATLQNNYCDELELVRCIIRDSQTLVARANRMFYGFDKQLGSGKLKSLTQSKQDDKQYVFEWYYMYDGKLCKKSSADVVEHPKFYQDKVAYSISGDSVELIGAMQDLELAVIPATMTWSGKDYAITAVSEGAFEQCNALKAVVDLNGKVKAEALKTSAPVYVANSNGNTKLKEFVSWKDNKFTYTGKAHKPTWMNNLSEFGVTAKANAQTTKTEVGEYTDSVAFTFTYQQQTFDAKIPCKYSIEPAPLTAEVQNAQRVYGQENPKFEVKYTGFVNGETAAVVTKAGEFATEATAKSDVGEYGISYSGAEAKNYIITAKAGKLTITPATLTAKVNDAARTYGDENPAFAYTLTGLVNGDTESVLTDKGQFLTTATKTSDVGQYTVICDGIEAKNYDVEVVPGTLTIGKATLVGRVNAATKVYGEENPKFTARYIGFRNGEDAKVLTSQGTFATKATAKSEVGEYEVTLSSAEAKNYTFEYEPGTLTISKAPLTAEVQNVQRAYGADNPQFTAKYTGFVNGDTEAVLTNKGTFATEATKESPAGEYAITLSGVEAKNYEVTTIAGKLTVAIAKLTVKVNNAERVYGDENPQFTYTLTGLLNGDRQEDVLTSVGTFTTEATKMSAVGEYAVKCTGVKARNYEVETVDGVLRVTPAQIIVRVNNAKRPYGEDNPQFTARYIGFRNSETDNVLTNKGMFITAATKTSDVGEYEITATNAQARNYTFEYEPGTLTIEQAEQQIVWNQELGDIAQFKQIELEATATSGLAVSYQVTQGSDVCSVVKVGKTTFLDCFGTGDVTLSAWQEGDKNYYPTLRTYKQVKVVPTGIGSVEAGDYTVTAKRGQLLIGGLRDGDTVIVTDLAGRTVYSGEEPVVYVARGSYVVRIGRQTWKVLVK